MVSPYWFLDQVAGFVNFQMGEGIGNRGQGSGGCRFCGELLFVHGGTRRTAFFRGGRGGARRTAKILLILEGAPGLGEGRGELVILGWRGRRGIPEGHGVFERRLMVHKDSMEGKGPLRGRAVVFFAQGGRRWGRETGARRGGDTAGKGEAEGAKDRNDRRCCR